MKMANIIFITDKYEENDEIDDYIDYFLHYLRMQGYIVDEPHSLLKNENKYIVNCRIPEILPLERIEENKWYKKLVELEVSIEISIQGEDMWSPDICHCKKSSFYILSGQRPIPILCGDCTNAVPLYRLPYTYKPDPSYYDIVSWNNKDKAWGNIEFSCAEREGIAQYELSNIKSEHSRNALEICKTIKNNTDIECFYELENLYDGIEIQDALEKKCPICSGDWLLKESLHDRFDFKCDNCHILSNFPYEIRSKCKENLNEFFLSNKK